MISKSISTSRKYAALYSVSPELAEFCQSLFPLLVVHSDDDGRQAGDSFTVKHVVCPTSPRSVQDVDAALRALECVGLIERPETASGPVVQIVKFSEHQPGLRRTGTKTRGTEPATCAPARVELKRTELNRTEEKKNESAEPPDGDSAPIDRVILTFPTTGPVRSWELTEAQLGAWVRLFPNLDVMAECRKALAWILAHPTKHKTARGMPAFIVRWLSNTTDNRRSNGSGAKPEREQRPDMQGHFPPCKTIPECRDRVLREAREAREAKAQ
jgi:hypothetical protein